MLIELLIESKSRIKNELFENYIHKRKFVRKFFFVCCWLLRKFSLPRYYDDDKETQSLLFQTILNLNNLNE